MSEFQFESPPAVGKTKHLMSEANSKDRFAANQMAHALVGIGQCFGIAGPIGQKNTFWIESEHFICRSCGRDNSDAESPLAQRAQNVAFHPVIKCHDVMTNGRQLRRLVARLNSSGELPEAFARYVASDAPEAYVLYRELDFFEQVAALEARGAFDLELIKLMLGRTLVDRWELWRPALHQVHGPGVYPLFEGLAAKLERMPDAPPGPPEAPSRTPA